MSLALIFVVRPGFSTFGVEVASSTSSPIKLGSLASPRARRLRFLPEVWAVSSVATVLFAVTPCPAKRVGVSFLSALVAVASAALFAGVVASKLGVSEAVDVAVAVDVAEAATAAVLVLLASLVEAGAVDVAATVDVAGAVIAAFAS